MDGKNRKPGLIRGCGGEGGDAPTEAPKHDFTCTDESELIHFTPIFGAVHRARRRRRSRPRRLGPGDGAAREHAAAPSRPTAPSFPAPARAPTGCAPTRNRARPSASREVVSGDGATLDGGTGVVNGGPRLVEGGAVEITAFAEGFVYPENPEFYYRFGERRNPRTLAGVTRGGNLLLVAVDGRRPGYSVGASFEESAAIMDALGARGGRQPRRRRLHGHDVGPAARHPSIRPDRREAHRRRGGALR